MGAGLEKTIALADEPATLALGAAWATILRPQNPPWIIFLKGDLGAGKTTLVRGFLRGMGYSGNVKSPTYTLVESYPLLYHFDLYRLSEPQALDFIGIHDYCKEPGMLWIEWPEQGRGFLPEPDLVFSLETVPEGRVLTVQLHSKRAHVLDLEILHG